MKTSEIFGFVFWAVFIIFGIGTEFLTCETRKNFFFKFFLFLGGFFIAGIILSLLGVIGCMILSPFFYFFNINWWFITIGF